MSSAIARELIAAAHALSRDLAALRFAPPVAHVYDPLQYAFAPYQAYVERFGATHKRIVLLGMNPGPFGMMQTGVPFGEVGLAGEVRPAPRGQERLKEAAKLGFSVAIVPKANAPKKPIEGLTIHAVERIEQAIEMSRGL